MRRVILAQRQNLRDTAFHRLFGVASVRKDNHDMHRSGGGRFSRFLAYCLRHLGEPLPVI